MVFAPVPLVDVLHSFTGILGALEALLAAPLVTVGHAALSHPVVLDPDISAAAGARVLPQQIPGANAAVHTAGGDEVASYGGFRGHRDSTPIQGGHVPA